MSHTWSPSGRAIGVGRSGVAAAAHVSASRGWAETQTRDWEEVEQTLPGSSGIALVVADLNDATAESLLKISHVVADQAPDLALGFLFGRGADQLLGAASRLACETSATGPARQLFFDGLGLDIEGANLVHASLICESNADVRALLAEPADVLYLVGHGNGVDLGVLKAAVCCRIDASAPAGELRVLPCFHGDSCRRGSDVETPAAAIGARRVINLSCWGVTLANPHFAPEFTLADGLMRSGTVESLITTVRVADIGAADVSLLYYLINVGLPMGLVANRANRLRLRVGKGADFICFGDPASRLPASVSRVSAQFEAGHFTIYLDRDGKDAAIRDISLQSPVSVHSDPIWITSDNINMAVWDPTQTPATLYATVDTGTCGSTAEFRCVERSELPILEDLASQLLEDLAFLTIYAAGARAASASPEFETEMVAAAYELSRALEAWPVAALPLWSCVRGATLAQLELTLETSLAALSEAVAAHYIHLVKTAGTLHPTPLWAAGFVPVCDERGTEPCVYCAAPVDIRVCRPRVGSARAPFRLRPLQEHAESAAECDRPPKRAGKRCLRYCQNCGLVFDGDVDMATWIDCPPEVRPGGRISCRVRVNNPYGTYVPARVVFTFEDFSRRRTTSAEVFASRLEPSGSQLEAELAIPAAVFPGVHSAGAMIMVGTKVCFLRRLLKLSDDSGRPISKAKQSTM